MNKKRSEWKSYRYASKDLQIREPFGDKRRLVSFKDVIRRRYGRIKVRLKYGSVLRRRNEQWRNCSALARKESETVSILAKYRGKEKYRPVLIRQVRMNRWRDMACGGRSLNDGISWGAVGIKYTSPDGDEACIFFEKFNLGKAKDDVCIVLKKNHFCCATCSAEVMNRSDITNESEYDFIISLYKPSSSVN